MRELVCTQSKSQVLQQELQSFWQETVKHKPHVGATAVLGNTAVKETEECAIPDYGALKNFELPNDTNPTFSGVINQIQTIVQYYTRKDIPDIPPHSYKGTSH